MWRRILVMAVVCACCGACLAMAGKAERESYALMSAAGTMSSAEMQAALETLGLRVERFVYEVPARHNLQLEVEEYRGGRLVGPAMEATAVGLPPGTHRLLIIERRTSAGLQFSFSYDAGEGGQHARMFGRAVSLQHVQATGWEGSPGNRLVPGRRVELLRFHGDRDAVRSSPASSSLEAAARTHDVVVAVFATLRKP